MCVAGQANAAELLSLADLWCLEAVKAAVLGALRRSMCNGFKRPAAGSPAAEAVPQVAALARTATECGLGDADGGLARLYGECTAWMAAWPARVWPSRTFATMSRSIQDDVLAAAIARLSPDTAPSVLAGCRALASGLPAVAWAARVGKMREALAEAALGYTWSHFAAVCEAAGGRRDNSECWGALLEELNAHVAVHPDPDPAVRVLAAWPADALALLYGPAAASTAAAAAARGAARAAAVAPGPAGSAPQAWLQRALDLEAVWREGSGESGSWLGNDEVRLLQALHDHLHSYLVRHMAAVSRSAAFRQLTPRQQSRLMQIAQEGLGTGGCAGTGLRAASGTSRDAALAAGAAGQAAAWLVTSAAAAGPGGGGSRSSLAVTPWGGTGSGG
ncbi:hypothetical protein GPECTOR_44g32 [Gonium pectorale]|uniref:BTBD8 BACK domain-containing protein n=1 Tax=Gonium pectorale TaxID=33097 RepID=A0A150G941_GONPE|nr:hypothetical protein GPECTOR_44g32 [Gonium pectorale]|eukprot:KXZ46354.1 hypothetical protein GPECTOR_44g32 [Gonium pectorale]